MADASAIKSINTEAVRRALRTFGGAMCKSELARAAGLSFPTVSRTVEALAHAGELLQNGPADSTGGRRAETYALNTLFVVSLAMRLERNSLHWFVMGFDGQRLTEGVRSCECGVLFTIDALLLHVRSRYPQVGSVAVGIGGAVNNGVIAEAFDFEELRGVNLAAYFAENHKLTAAIENDMNVVTAGRQARHCSNPAAAVVCIYFTNGCAGAGVSIGGVVWHGASGFSGELFYLPVGERGRGGDMIAYYGRVIRAYVAIINPDRVVLYENRHITGRLDDILRACAPLPARVIPRIEISREFALDYECGLAAIAQELLTTAPII